MNELVFDGPKSLVYRAIHEETGRPVTIEVHRDEFPSAVELASMRRAYDLSIRLAIPSVVRHVALERYRNRLALVTEDVDAVSLASLIGMRRMTIGDFLELAIGIAGALGELHEHHVIHNGIKPQNIVVSRASGEVKLIDLGIATEIEGEVHAERGARSVHISPHYASPEQTGRIHRPVDQRSDLYSFGVCCYEMLLGCVPFDSDDPMELLHCHIARRPEPPHEVEPTIPETISRIVMKLLAKTSDARYQSAAGVRHDLAECLAQLREKGVVEPFPLGLRDASSRFQLPQRLIAREGELDRLVAAFEAVASGEGRVVMVTGHAGVGKTALVQELRQHVAARRGHFCAGKFDLSGRDAPYLAFAEALRSLVRTVLAGSAAAIDRLRDELAATLGHNGRALVELVPELETLLGAGPEPGALGPLESQRRFRRALKAFVQVFAGAEHPLVLFLDDLQWADAASIEALRILVGANDLPHLLVLGGYRENQLARGHAVLELLDELAAAGRPATNLRLLPLDAEAVTRLVAETVRTTPEQARPLARLVHEKTNGNPFFVRQLLRMLHQEQLVRFDAERGSWSWELERVRDVGITENVVDLLASRFARLPAETREILAVAASIGAEFDLRTLAIVRDCAPLEAARALSPALAENLVVSRDVSHSYVEALARVFDRDHDFVNASYRFLHDRVQQAAHDAMPEEERASRHLRIGRLLLAEAGPRLDAELLTEIVSHMNAGQRLVTAPEERLHLAALNLEAGRRAKALLALEAAARCFDTGRALLPARPPEGLRELTLALHTEAAEVAFARGDRAAMDRHVEAALAHARTTLERVPIHTIEIRSGIAANEHCRAVDVALGALAELGIVLPRHPGRRHLLRAMAETRLALGKRAPLDLMDLEPLDDPRVRAAMHLLVSASTCAYFAEPTLVPLLGMTLVQLSLEHGNAGFSAFGYATYALFLAGGLHRIEEGYAFGELARAVLARYPDPSLANVHFVVDVFVRHFKDPLADLAADLLGTWRRASDVGDVATATYAGGGALLCAIFSGAHVEAILEVHGPSIAQALESNQEQTKPGIAPWVELLEALRDLTRRDGALRGEVFDVDAERPALDAADNDASMAQAATAAGILSHFHGDLRAAREHFARASAVSRKLLSHPIVPQLHFYRAMNGLRLAAEPGTSRAERARWLVAARLDVLRLAGWARYSPTTFASKVALLEALELSVRGQVGRAIERFQRAVEGAQNAGLVHEAALAAERLAEHCQRAALEDLALHYLRKAHLLYSQWGARGKVRALELAHYELFRTPPEHLGVPLVLGETTGSLDEQLDVASVVKAVQTLAQEMDLERLLSRVMRVVIENAGAERAVLLTVHDGELRVEAEGGLDGTTVLVDGPAAHYEASGVCPAIVAYAARVRQSVVLADASADPFFGRDPWVVKRGARSILCAPLLRRGTLKGLIFLENSLVAGAFTPSRIRVLDIICGQAAVSIESARLYRSLEDALEAQVRLTTAHSRFVPHQFLQALDRQHIVDVELGDHASKEMSVLFSDIRGFTRHMERLTPSQGLDFLNTYLSRMEAPILAYGGFVDSYVGDAIMALFETSADHAVRAAIGMLAALDTLNRERERVGEPPIREGVGINTGMLMLGTIGGRNHLKCGVIGDSVNVAARVETLTKQYGVTMLVGAATYERLEDPGRYMHRRIERVRVVGRESPITVYEIFDADPPARRDAKLAIAGRFAEALAAYYERDFAAAAALFEECTRLAPDDRVSAIHLERCRTLVERGGVSPDWDGVMRLASK